MYAEAVVPALQGIQRALHILDRIRAAGREDVLGRALAPGMFDCATQLKTVGIFALRSTYTLVGRDWPKEMLGQGFAPGPDGLEARLRLAADQVKALKAGDFAGAAARSISHVAGEVTITQPGEVYLRQFALPNLWFHLSMAYAIARVNGLELGKGDFDGWHEYEAGFSFVERPAAPVAPVPGWVAPPRPSRMVLKGRYATLEPLGLEHVAGLREAQGEDDGSMWAYLPVGPHTDESYRAWVEGAMAADDPLHFAVRMADGRLGGTLSMMRIFPEAGTIETGWLTFAPRLQRTREATEAVYLLMKWSFEAGYRRFEWKCDAANRPSRRAAERFGMSYEGVFRQAAVVKGRNRDTAWFACIDREWPALRAAYEAWLDPANFDDAGRQRRALGELTAPVLVARDPG